MILEVDEGGTCTLNVAPDDEIGEFYVGKCVVDRSKLPVSLSIKGMFGYEFDLHTIVQFLDEDRYLLAPFAVRERARPMTFDNALVMHRTG